MGDYSNSSYSAPFEEDEWVDMKRAKRVTWRGVQYDSQLEADWASTFVAWSMEHRYHPGRIYLGDSIWEPDFQVDAGSRDLLFEVKGAANHRIEKVIEARGYGYNVVVGRVGLVPAGSDLESAGAMWEPADDWIVVGGSNGTSRFHYVHDAFVGHGPYFSADYALEHGLNGLLAAKAVNKDGEDVWVINVGDTVET